MGSFAIYWRDRRGQQFRYQARFAFAMCIYGWVLQVLYYSNPEYERLFLGLSALQLLRIFMTHSGFRKITYCFVLGIKPITAFIILTTMVIYTFAVIAHWLFIDVTNVDGTVTFATLADSWVAMYQVFIGEGWHSIMAESVNQTNNALTWFFAGYVLLVGVLLSNLFVGILLNMFAYGSSAFKTVEGEVKLALRVHLEEELEEHVEKELIQGLGHVAAILHYPVEALYPHTFIKFEQQIKQFANIEAWAANMVKAALMRTARLNHCSHLRKLLLDRCWAEFHHTPRTVLLALTDVFKDAQMLPEDNIRSSTQLRMLTRNTCVKLELPDWLQTGVEQRFEFMLGSWEKMSVTRKKWLGNKGASKDDKGGKDLGYHGLIVTDCMGMVNSKFHVNFVKAVIYVIAQEPEKMSAWSVNSSTGGWP